MMDASKKGGLLAAQRAIKNIQRFVSASRIRVRHHLFFAFVALVFVNLTSCDKKQEGLKSDNMQERHAMASKDSLEKPKVNIQVNRRYDDKGNLIGFDSTYSSFYSNVKGDTVKMDSLMHSFDRYFNLNHSSFLDKQFNRLFFEDSLRYPDFFHRDFFLKRYQLNDKYMKETMRRMDSVKNRFFHEYSKKNNEPKDL